MGVYRVKLNGGGVISLFPTFLLSFPSLFYLFSCDRFIILVCSLNELDVFP